MFKKIERIDEFIAFTNNLMKAWERYEGKQYMHEFIANYEDYKKEKNKG